MIEPDACTPAETALRDQLAAAQAEALEQRARGDRLAAALEEERRVGAQFRQMTDHFPNGSVAMFDRALRFTACCGQTGGLMPADVVGKPPREFLGGKGVDASEAWYREILAGKSLVSERAFRGRTFVLHGQPIPGEDGEIVGGIVVSQDITERVETEKALRESEERYRLLFQNASEAIYILHVEGDHVGTIVEANEMAAALHGYTVAELQGTDVRMLLPPDLVISADARLRHTGNKEWGEGETVHVRRDGTPFPAGYSAGPLILGGRRCVLVIMHDITEQRRAIEALQLAKESAERANRELETFSYSVAHDLRAPLRGVSGFAQILIEEYADKLDAEGVDCLEEIQGGAMRMGDLIDGLLSLSQVTRSELRRERVDLTALAEALAADLALGEPDRGVDVVIARGLGADADLPLVRMLLGSLLGNAWKFTRNNAAARIEVGAAREGGATVFFLRDNGAGFDMAYAGKLFGAFQRLHTVHEFPGAGIGLATAQRIVRRHGGRIWAEGAVGAGATLRFTLAEPAAEGLSSPK